MQKSNLVVITVHKGSIHKLKKTLRSIDSQLCQPHLNIIIAKNISLYQISTFRKNNRIFILNKDKSIYNAMNIGLRNKLINNKFIIFINSGDMVFNKRVIYDLEKYFILNMPDGITAPPCTLSSAPLSDKSRKSRRIVCTVTPK